MFSKSMPSRVAVPFLVCSQSFELPTVSIELDSSHTSHGALVILDACSFDRACNNPLVLFGLHSEGYFLTRPGCSPSCCESVRKADSNGAYHRFVDFVLYVVTLCRIN
jgi:hypothetical protein